MEAVRGLFVFISSKTCIIVVDGFVVVRVQCDFIIARGSTDSSVLLTLLESIPGGR